MNKQSFDLGWEYTEATGTFAMLTGDVTGAGKLLAVGTANPISEELYVGPARKAWHGRLMAVVSSTGQVGEIVLTARADGLASVQMRLEGK